MRLKLFHKLLAALVVATFASVVLFAGTTYWYVGKTFLRFINDERGLRLEALATDLGDIYRQDHGWDRLREEPRVWRRLLAERRPQSPPLDAAARLQPGGPDYATEMMPPGAPSGPPPRYHLRRPPHPTLYDERQQIVLGRTPFSSKLILKAIVVDERTVGWVGLPRLKRPDEPREVRYLKRQMEGFGIAAAIVIVLSLGVAIVMARRLAHPIMRISTTARALASGQYDARAQVRGQDEIGALADDVNQLARTLKENETARRRWIADISHELRTPLAIMQGEIEAVKDGLRRADEAFIDSLREENLRLTRLVDDLYQLARADIGALEYDFERCSLAAIATEAINRYAHRFAEAGLEYAYEISPDVMIRADKRRLMQMIENVFENCCRYVRMPGRVRITLERNGTHAVLAVDDSGPGVTGDDLAWLFEPLRRAETSRSREFGGSGLGLAICKRIAEAHGGEIEAVHSSCGGLCVRMRLPITV